MSDVKRWEPRNTAFGYDMQPLPDGSFVLFDELDRVTAERDALQMNLTTSDEKNDNLSVAYLRANDREHELRKEIVMLRAALKFYADSDHYSTDDGLNWDSCSGEPANILWHESEPWFIEDGSIARAGLAQSVEATEQNEAQQCQPQGEPVAYVDYSASGGVRWRPWEHGNLADGAPLFSSPAEQPAPVAVAQIAGFNVVEDSSIPPGQIRMCNCNQGRLPCTCKPTAYDGFDNGTD